VAALMLCAAAASGQGTSAMDVSAGYSYLRANAPPGQCGCFNMNGGSGSFAAYLGHGFSAVGDFGGYYQGNVANSGESLTLETYLFGPRYSFHRGKKVTPFTQFLIGGAHGSGSTYSTSVSSLSGTGTSSGSANGLAFTAGGGLDWNINKTVSIRLVQAEYLMTRLANGVNGYQNNLRLTFGVVFHFGKSRGN
jgi:peptidoglycan-associated lipoprotein